MARKPVYNGYDENYQDIKKEVIIKLTCKGSGEYSKVLSYIIKAVDKSLDGYPAHKIPRVKRQGIKEFMIIYRVYLGNSSKLSKDSIIKNIPKEYIENLEIISKIY